MVCYLGQLESMTSSFVKLCSRFLYFLFLPPADVFVLFNKREGKVLCQRHTDTERHRHRDRFTRQISGSHRFRLIQQTERHNRRQRQKQRIHIWAHSCLMTPRESAFSFIFLMWHQNIVDGSARKKAEVGSWSGFWVLGGGVLWTKQNRDTNNTVGLWQKLQVWSPEFGPLCIL